MTYEGQRQVEVEFRENSVGCKMWEHRAEVWYSLGRVDRSWCKGIASRHSLKGGARSPHENSEVFAGQNLLHD